MDELKRPHNIQTDEELIEESARMDALFGEIAIRTFRAVTEIRDWLGTEMLRKNIEEIKREGRNFEDE